MKPENLETLLLDRALGQLAPEVADLLDAHLDANPAAAARAQSLAATVGRARAAVALPAIDLPREMAPSSWQRTERSWRWRAAGRETLKIAACIATGLAVGWSLRRAPTPPAVTAVAMAPVHARAAGANPTPAAAFWIAARREAEANRASDESAPRPVLRWPALEKTGSSNDSR